MQPLLALAATSVYILFVVCCSVSECSMNLSFPGIAEEARPGRMPKRTSDDAGLSTVKVALASTNAIKLEAAEAAFKRAFPQAQVPISPHNQLRAPYL